MAGRSAHSCSSPGSRSRKVDRRTFANRDFWLRGTGNRFPNAVSPRFFVVALRAWALLAASARYVHITTAPAIHLASHDAANVGLIRRSTSGVASRESLEVRTRGCCATASLLALEPALARASLGTRTATGPRRPPAVRCIAPRNCRLSRLLICCGGPP